MTELNRLKIVLVEQKKTGKWLAAQLGKSTCTVSKWCSNTVQPDLHTLDQISKLLNVNVKELINDTNIKKSKKTVIPYRNDCFSSAKQNIVAIRFW